MFNANSHFSAHSPHQTGSETGTNADAHAREHARRGLAAVFGLLGSVWLAAKLLSQQTPPLFVHASLAILFGGAGVWLLVKALPMFTAFFVDNRIAANELPRKFFAANVVALIVQKPLSRKGMIVCFFYFTLSVLVFAVASFTVGFEDSLRTALLPLKNPEALFVSVVAPLYEEVFFRAALLPVLWTLIRVALPGRNIGFWVVYLNALVFWIFHLPLQPEVWISAFQLGGIPVGPGPFLLGLVTAFVYYKDESVWSAFVFHAMANSLGGVWALALAKTNLFQLFYS